MDFDRPNTTRRHLLRTVTGTTVAGVTVSALTATVSGGRAGRGTDTVTFHESWTTDGLSCDPLDDEGVEYVSVDAASEAQNVVLAKTDEASESYVRDVFEAIKPAFTYIYEETGIPWHLTLVDVHRTIDQQNTRADVIESHFEQTGAYVFVQEIEAYNGLYNGTLEGTEFGAWDGRADCLISTDLNRPDCTLIHEVLHAYLRLGAIDTWFGVNTDHLLGQVIEDDDFGGSPVDRQTGTGDRRLRRTVMATTKDEAVRYGCYEIQEYTGLRTRKPSECALDVLEISGETYREQRNGEES